MPEVCVSAVPSFRHDRLDRGDGLNSDAPPSGTPKPLRPPAGRPGLLLTALALFLGLLPVVSVGLALRLPGPLKEDATVVIPRGASIREIAGLLAERNIVSNPVVFRIAAKILASDSLRAGEFRIAPGLSPWNVVLTLRDSRPILRRLTVPEGLTVQDVMALLRGDAALTGEMAAVPAEGGLLPETYGYTYGDSRADLVARMEKARREALDALWAGRDPGLPLDSPQEAVVMASLIEKETGKRLKNAPASPGFSITACGWA
jgi:UPF0755 protein